MGRCRLVLAAVVLILLGQCRAQEAQSPAPTKLDLDGEPLPTGAIARLGSMHLRHAAYGATSAPLAFTTDGKTLLSASQGDRKLRFFDVATGKPTEIIALEPVAEYWWPHIALSADGSTLAARVGLQGIYVWTTAGRATPHKLPVEPRLVWSLALSADGRVLALGCNDSKIRIWDVVDRKEWILPLEVVTHALFLSEDGKRIAVYGQAGGSIHVLEVESAKEIARLPRSNFNTSTNQMLAFSPDHRLLATWNDTAKRADQSVSLLDLEGGKEIRKMPGHGPPLAFSADGKALTTYDGKAIHVWDLKTGKARRTLEFTPYGIAFSPDGRMLALRGHASLHFWNLETGKLSPKPAGHSSPVVRVAFSPDGKRLASGGWDKIIRVWDSANGKLLTEFEGMQPIIPPPFLTFSADGRVLVSGGLGSSSLGREFTDAVRRWDASSGKELPRFDAPELKATDLATEGLQVRLSNDGTMLILVRRETGSRRVVLKGWDLASGKELFQPKEARRFPELLSRSGKARVSTALPDLEGPPAPKFGDDKRRTPVFSADGKLMAVNVAGDLSRVPDISRIEPPGLDVWETASGAKIRQLAISPSSWLAFARSGRYLAAVGLTAIQVFDLATGKEVVRFAAPEQFRSYPADDCCPPPWPSPPTARPWRPACPTVPVWSGTYRRCLNSRRKRKHQQNSNACGPILAARIRTRPMGLCGASSIPANKRLAF